MDTSRIASIFVVLFVVGDINAQAQEDRSLPTKIYVDHGMPSPAKPWTDRNFRTALTELKRLAKSNPEQLPRFDSPNSGVLFARFIASENFTRLAAKNVPASQRPLIMEIADALTDIEQLYRDAERTAGLNYHRERVAVLASRLDCDKLTAQIAIDYVDNGDHDDPARKVTEELLPKIRKGTAQLLEYCIKLIGDASVEAEGRSRLADALSRDSGLFAFPEPPRRSYLLHVLQVAADGEKDPAFKSKLDQLSSVAAAAKLDPFTPTAADSSVTPMYIARKQVDDTSLTLDEYYRLGIPSLERAWSVDEQEKVALALEKLGGAQPLQLPRLDSKKSGTLFARIIDPENTSGLKDKNRDVASRGKLLGAAQALTRINGIYERADRATGRAYQREIEATHVALITSDGGTSQLMIETMQVLRQRSAAPQGLDGQLEKMRQAFSRHLNGAIKSLGDPDVLDLPERTKMADTLAQNMDSILDFLEPDQRSETARLLKDAVAGEPDEKLKSKLRELEKTARATRPNLAAPAAPAGRGN